MVEGLEALCNLGSGGVRELYFLSDWYMLVLMLAAMMLVWVTVVMVVAVMMTMTTFGEMIEMMMVTG